jgi:hypothetical protein
MDFLHDAAALVAEKLGGAAQETRITENGRGARGKVVCRCNRLVGFTACTHVWAVWINCDDCGIDNL